MLVQDQSKAPSPSVLDQAADCPIFTSNGEKVSFKSLYWAELGQRRRTLIIFIRHFFCGVCESLLKYRMPANESKNCQEYVRSLKAQIPPDSLPSDLSIIIIGCGSHTLIPSYITETGCPYPIYTDPSKKLYDILGMHRSLSLGRKDPDYIQHTLVAGMMKSFVQTVKRFPAGDALSGGDMRVNGGEFLFEVQGNTAVGTSSQGNAGLKDISVTWCHRMTNSRNHTEVEQIRTVIGLGWEENAVKRRPEDNSRINGRVGWSEQTTGQDHHL
jgi:AhpC/TSA antioxidant enzyme